jgi:hypothetical protein
LRARGSATIFELDRDVMVAEAVLEIVLERSENPGGAAGHGSTRWAVMATSVVLIDHTCRSWTSHTSGNCPRYFSTSIGSICSGTASTSRSNAARTKRQADTRMTSDTARLVPSSKPLGLDELEPGCAVHEVCLARAAQVEPAAATVAPRRHA